MNSFIFSRISLVGLVLLLGACSIGNPYADIDEFVAATKAKAGGFIKPVPPLRAYTAFTYSASGMRSPFARPVEVKEVSLAEAGDIVVPDFNRAKEYLEQFSLDSMRMVGSLEMEGVRWALMRDGDGGVYRVKRGNFLGRNHGKINEVSETYVTIVEIVSNGGDAWIERPRTMSLVETE